MNMTCVPQSFIIISKNFKQYFVNKCILISFNNYIVRKLKNRFFFNDFKSRYKQQKCEQICIQ